MKFQFIITILCWILFHTSTSAQSGCKDVFAKNYDGNATENDGSCRYKKLKIKEFKSIILSDSLNEVSGLMEWENHLYTHNDDTDLYLYQLNKEGNITRSIKLEGIKNKDCEEISQDDTHIYLGDFGNNSKGNRTDLSIYKIAKESLFDHPKIEKITFSYPEQTDFSKQKSNTTNFDCEAFIATENELILFTKQWSTKQTAVYRLPKEPGNHKAEYITSLQVNGLITGANYLASKNLISLCGYSKKLKPFIYLISDWNELNFEKTNQRKIKLQLPFHQIEGISTTNGLDYFLINEGFTKKLIGTIQQQLHFFSLDVSPK
ncbi:T9SS C-terminal target domain-containing protein [Flavobacterium piscinae]|uniref:T9SS C-terminal target domain-containing protein n=1 Tax=Flavobacterium piscinae TaxID=2506424 RepID=A0A4Q1KV28_9FLAO|nr:T9SS C-terminal target domain-containing protein [Flavobacterium piscinae]RXR34121.1 T9SS C-terminal target domain-containing protein [Flavobacterium piscinae]